MSKVHLVGITGKKYQPDLKNLLAQFITDFAIWIFHINEPFWRMIMLVASSSYRLIQFLAVLCKAEGFCS